MKNGLILDYALALITKALSSPEPDQWVQVTIQQGTTNQAFTVRHANNSLNFCFPLRKGFVRGIGSLTCGALNIHQRVILPGAGHKLGRVTLEC